MLSLPARGTLANASVIDLSSYDEISSADIPAEIYAFGGKGGGVQRLLRYRTEQGEILIPTIELIRHLFLHNRALANAVMRPGALNLLFHPEIPGFRSQFTLRFTARVPKSSLSHQFAQHFAWIALDPDARRAWDSVCLQSRGKQYVTFTPPPLKNSAWRFRGLQFGNKWLVLELLHLTGKNHPCEQLFYGHPSMKEISRSALDEKAGANSVNGGAEVQNEQIIYDYELDNGSDGAKAAGQKSLDVYFKYPEFDSSITVKKLMTKLSQVDGTKRIEQATKIGKRIDIHKTVKVSAAEQSLGAKLPPLEFRHLKPASWDCIGDLEALASTINQMARKLTQARFAMSLCQLKTGRVFSMANRKPRVGLVVTITSTGHPPIALLDVERTGNIALSLIALRFHQHASFNVVEESVKLAFDGLVDSSGRWPTELEGKLKSKCICERLPKMLIPRDKVNEPGQTVLWAVKLISKLKLQFAL